ncbi:hypothetical protein BRC83_07570 [Halobacteriales archaeon QS_1_68_17]|nr:MAG: hypothetical protein BRC83_07570 [Halobacteriales archaeon QS_1_68_17]
MTDTTAPADVATAAREREDAGTEDPVVSAHRVSATRTVFTENENTDAWIATDLTVELRE